MTTLFFFLLASGLLMICLEIFLPGGIIGIFGVIALAGAITIGFMAFGHETGMFLLVGVVVLLCVSVIVWIKFFPKTVIGRSMTLASDGKDFKSSDDRFRELVGKEARALTALRPAGLVQLNGAKYNVVSEGNLVAQGETVRIVKASGNRIVVRQVEEKKSADS